MGAFAQYGRMSEVVQYLRQTLDCKQHELRPAEMEGLSNMMVLAYVQQLLEDRGRTNELTYDLRLVFRIPEINNPLLYCHGTNFQG